MERLRDIGSEIVDLKGRIAWKFDHLEFQYDPRAVEAQRVFNGLAQPLYVYLNEDHREHTPPSILQVQTPDGAEYTSIRRFEGDQLADFPVIEERPYAEADYTHFSLLLPRQFELEKDQLTVMITPRGFRTDAKNLARLYQELSKRGVPVSALDTRFDPHTFNQFPEDVQRRVLYQQGYVYNLITRDWVDLYNADQWSPGYGNVQMVGKFSNPLFGNKYYGGYIQHFPRQVKAYMSRPKILKEGVQIYESGEIYTASEREIDCTSFLRYGRLYILQKGSSETEAKKGARGVPTLKEVTA